MTTPHPNVPPRATAIRRYGPLVAIVSALVLVAVLVTVTGRPEGTGTTAAGGGVARPAGGPPPAVPLTYELAKQQGKEKSIKWVDNCDPTTGRIKMPTRYAPPCVPAFSGDNGGATGNGVTAQAIKIVYYVAAQNGDALAALAGNLDPPEKAAETVQKYVEMWNNLASTYGRKVELEFFQSKAQANDAVAARAEAQAVIDQYHPFASINGPGLTPDYADELARQNVLCLNCGVSLPDSFYQEHSPYIWGSAATPEQYLGTMTDYIVKRLAGRNATFAGDAALQSKKRSIGIVHFEQDPPQFSGISAATDNCSKQVGWSPEFNEPYILDLGKLPERANTLVSKLKAAGITTVFFLGDPIMPTYLTQEATRQGYFPEWLIAGTVLTDTAAFARRYDQRQWRHAFGLSQLPVRLPRTEVDSWRLHQWYFGTPPAAEMTNAVIWPTFLQLFTGIHLAGPTLNPETFKQGLFSAPPSGGGPTTPSISYGDHGYYKIFDANSCELKEARPDYLGVDDMVEVWWDASTTGKDEQGKDGQGVYRYANNGKRYLPGKMPEQDSDAFKPADAITEFTAIPPEDRTPAYPSPRK